MEILLTLIHITVSLFLVFVVLLQSGQAADLAGAFGGGGSQTALGMRGAATLLQKLTTAAAVIFMVTSLALGIVGRSERSVIEGIEGAQPATPSLPPGQETGQQARPDARPPGQGPGQGGAEQQGTSGAGQPDAPADPGRDGARGPAERQRDSGS